MINMLRAADTWVVVSQGVLAPELGHHTTPHHTIPHRTSHYTSVDHTIRLYHTAHHTLPHHTTTSHYISHITHHTIPHGLCTNMGALRLALYSQYSILHAIVWQLANPILLVIAVSACQDWACAVIRMNVICLS